MEAQVCRLHPVVVNASGSQFTGHWCAYCHEREDSTRPRRTDPWYPRFYFDLDVCCLSSIPLIVLRNLVPSDKAERSVPAPGKGALTVAREVPSKHPLPILDVAYRSRQLSFRRKQISEWLSHEHAQLQAQQEFQIAQGEPVDREYVSSRIANIEQEAAQQEKDALAMYGMLEGTDPRIAPLRRALAIWGLTADDIGVLSIHGTSTNANVCIFLPYLLHFRSTTCLQEENETNIWNDIFTKISRTPGNAVPIMAQKSLLGHSKGGSAAWQMAGLLQTVTTGIVPGNRNSEYVFSVVLSLRFNV